MPRPVARARGRARRHGHRARCCPAGSTPTAIRCCCCRCRTRRASAASPRRRPATSSTSTATTATAARSSSSSTSRSSDTAGQIATKPLLVRVSPQPALDGAVVRGRRHDRCRAHRRCRPARDRHRRARSRSSRCACSTTPRRRATDRRRHRHPSTSPPAPPARSASDFTVTDGTTPRDRHRAHHDPARRCAAAAGDLARRRVRAPAGGRDARRVLRGLEPDQARAAAERRRRARGCRRHPLGRRRGSELPPRLGHDRHRAPRAGSAPSRTRSATAPTTRAHASRARPRSSCCRPRPSSRPIAVDDTVVVRAGSQIDIPVLENDIAPAGGRPTLNPASIVSSSPATRSRSPAATCCATSRPTEPGEYAIDYSVFTTGRSGARRHGDRARPGAARRRQPRARCPRRSRAGC